jgi:hypothetical protein
MSTPNIASIIETANAQIDYDKCKKKCGSDGAGGGSRRQGTYRAVDPERAAAWLACTTRCKELVAKNLAGPIDTTKNVAFQLELYAEVAKLNVSNQEAKSAATQKMVGSTGTDGCATDYVDAAGNLQTLFDILLQEIDATGVKAASWVNFTTMVGIHSGNGMNSFAIQAADPNNTPAEQAENLGYIHPAKKDIQNSVPGRAAGTLGIPGHHIKNVLVSDLLPGPVQNIDSIYDANSAKNIVATLHSEKYKKTGTIATAGAGMAQFSHPWGWESVVGAFLKQVNAVLNTTPSKSALGEAAQSVEVEEGALTGYQQITSGILGDTDSEAKAPGAGVTMGSAAGILKYGAPTFWPPHSKAAKQLGDQRDAHESSPAVTETCHPLGGLRFNRPGGCSSPQLNSCTQ